jgi:hypothetical protein
MKKSIIILFLLLISFINSYGQWYTREYNVTDINFLSKEQLKESLGESKKDLLLSAGIAGFGGIVFLIAKYTDPSLDDDATFFEQLIGEEGMQKLGIVTGLGLLAGGTIASIASLCRLGRIKSVINKNYPSIGSINISPAIILNSNLKSYCPGVTITYNF